MNEKKIKSYAKINLSLGILGKFNLKYHKIESIVSLINLYDDISIKKINTKKHQIIFYGRFSKKIPKKNTISKLLDILDKGKLLNNKKYRIKINKKIPTMSGLGGGSMNSSSILRYFLKKNKINMKYEDVLNITNKIGSDVILGMQNKPMILTGDGKIISLNKKFDLYTLIIKPNFGCSTKKIYKNVKIFSRPLLNYKKMRNLDIKKIINLNNDLERVAFKLYPGLHRIKKYMIKLPNIMFVRMTGSGSSIIGYFISKKASINATKILKKKYKNYWCILSKTI